jgi:nitroreductase
MSEIIKDLNWRYATKSFDTSKKVSEEDLQEIVESFRLTPSSFGLEPWKLVVVETQELKDKLKEFSFNQSQISDSSHVLVFTRVVDLNDEYVDKFLDNQSKITGASREDLE